MQIIREIMPNTPLGDFQIIHVDGSKFKVNIRNIHSVAVPSMNMFKCEFFTELEAEFLDASYMIQPLLFPHTYLLLSVFYYFI